MRARAVFATLVMCHVAVSRPGFAGGAGRAVDCDDIRNTYESNVCADRAFKEADAKLNDVYKRVLAHIAESGMEKPYDGETWASAMKVAQRAWLAFRDADCKGVVTMEWTGGSGTSAAVLGCMTEKTKVRSEELAERYSLK